MSQRTHRHFSSNQPINDSDFGNQRSNNLISDELAAPLNVSPSASQLAVTAGLETSLLSNDQTLSSDAELASLSVNATFGTIPQLANYLVNGFWTGYSNTIAHRWAITTVTYNLGDLNAQEQSNATTALALWSSVCNVTFVQTNGPANIIFNHDKSGVGTGAGTSAHWTDSGQITDATVDIASDFSSPGGVGSYMFQSYIHEIGHALGLGHQGPYNETATYGVDNIFTNDTWQWSVMSYFPQNDYSGLSSDFIDTPQMADVFAVQGIYGANANTRTDNTTYGYNTTGDINANLKNIYDFSLNSAPDYCIYDAGGLNTLDCSGYFGSQIIDLRPGSFSSILGLKDNISIAENTQIQVAIGGSGNDTIIGAGGDSLTGGAGGDYFVPSEDDVIMDFTVDDRIDISNLPYVPPGPIVSYVYPTFAVFNKAESLLTVSDGPFMSEDIYVHGDLLYDNFVVTSDGGGGTIIALSASPLPPLPAPTGLKLAPDSDSGLQGDGITNINTPTIAGSGAFGDTIMLFDGTKVIGEGTVGFFAAWSITTPTLTGGPHVFTAIQSDEQGGTSSLSLSLSVFITAKPPSDFNGDGMSDIAFQNTDGSVTAWDMNSASVRSNGASALANPGTSWKLIGTGDFYAGGTANLLFQNSLNGLLAYWGINQGADGPELDMSRTVQLPNNLDPGPNWRVIATGDFNDDGNADIAFQNNIDGSVAVWQMNGASLVTNGATVLADPGTSWRLRATGDFYGDGTSDLLFQNSSGALAIWGVNQSASGPTLDMTETVALPNNLDPGPNWVVKGRGDFNVDGKSDFVFQNAQTGDVAIWEMNGASLVSAAVIASPGTAWTVKSIGDCNGDGASDVLLQNSQSGALAMWFMNGLSLLPSSALLSANPGIGVSPVG